ncbi:MAG: methyltransferase [Arenicellales bacterium]
MSDSWDDYAEEWDTNIDAISYSAKAYESLIKEINIQGKTILDFGCGTGLLTERLSPLANSIVAIDTSPKMIAVLQSKKLPNVTYLSEPLTSELVKNNTAFVNKFNIVVASSVFSFLPNYDSILKLLRTLLVADGLLIQWDWLSPGSNPEFGLSETTIKKSLDNAGFKKIVLTKPFSLTTQKGNMPVIMGIAKNA